MMDWTAWQQWHKCHYVSIASNGGGGHRPGGQLVKLETHMTILTFNFFNGLATVAYETLCVIISSWSHFFT